MKKIFNILGKIFDACMGIYGFYCSLVLVIEFYGLITNNPNANIDVNETYLTGALISTVYFQGKKLNELEKKINGEED